MIGTIRAVAGSTRDDDADLIGPDAELVAQMGIYARGGLTVTGLLREFRDPAWAGRGQYRSLKQFIMNWNNWPDSADRSAMLDGRPRGMPRDERTRVAAVVRCLCERDGRPLPWWVRLARPAKSRHGVFAISDRPLESPATGGMDRYSRAIRDCTPAPAHRYRVWFDPAFLEST